MRPHHLLQSFILLSTTVFAANFAHAKPRVEIEILAEPGLATVTASQRWTKLLGELGVANVRVRGAQAGDKLAVQTTGQGDSATHRVVGQLNARGQLQLPGGNFGISDRDKLAAWLATLQTVGGEGVGKGKTVFGLTETQFNAVLRDLATPVSGNTKGLKPLEAITKILEGLTLRLNIDPAIARALEADEPVRDELDGISSGTALAAIARPAGGILLPRAVGGQIELALVAPAEGVQGWPIGWPPQEQDEKKLIEDLYKFIEVELDDVPAADAIAAIQGRLKVPLLYDHNNLTRHRIDLKKGVKVPPGKSYYRKILERVLFQAGLKFEVRVDDADKPLLWVTTLKP